MSIGEASPSWVTQSCVGGREEPSLGEDGTGREEEKQAKLGWVVLPLVPEHRLTPLLLLLSCSCIFTTLYTYRTCTRPHLTSFIGHIAHSISHKVSFLREYSHFDHPHF